MKKGGQVWTPYRLLNILNFKNLKQVKVMKKNLKVCRKWQGSKAVPTIQLQGIYLREYNFNIDDNVRVEFYRDEIRIKKLTPEMVIKNLAEQDQAFARFCDICQ